MGTNLMRTGHTGLIRWMRAAGRVAAWLAGAKACDIFVDYETFERDSSILFDTVEDFYNSAKWILEERERTAPNVLQEATESAVVSVPPADRLDDEGAE